MKVALVILSTMAIPARAGRTADALGRAGHDVAVFALRDEGLAEREDRGTYVICRVADMTSASWKQPRAKLQQSKKRTRDLREAIQAWNPDVVHCNDLDTMKVGVELKRVSGCKLVYDAFELYDEMLIADRASVPVPVLWYWRHLDSRLGKQADAIITVSDEIAEIIMERTGKPVSVILNAPSLVPLIDAQPLSETVFNDSSALVVLYQGLIAESRGLEKLVEALALVEPARLVLQGPIRGNYLESISLHAMKCGVSEKVHYDGVLPPEKLQEACCAAEVGYLAYLPTSLNNVYSMPNKFMQYMMAGLPLLGAQQLISNARIIKREKIGFLCDPSDTASIADALVRFQDVSLRESMSARARMLAETRYNWEVEENKLLRLYDDLAG